MSRFDDPTPRRGRRAAFEWLWIALVGVGILFFTVPGFLKTPSPSALWYVAAIVSGTGAFIAWLGGRWLGHRHVQAADYRLCLRCRGPLEMRGDTGVCHACGREYSRVTLVWCWSNTYALGGDADEDDWPPGV